MKIRIGLWNISSVNLSTFKTFDDITFALKIAKEPRSFYFIIFRIKADKIIRRFDYVGPVIS